jgi:hypothetical protein
MAAKSLRNAAIRGSLTVPPARRPWANVMLEPSVPRRRRWLIFLPFGLVVVLALGWSAIWYYAATAAETAIAGWREREARLGRVYSCGAQTIGGFPFRIEVRCREPAAELRNIEAPLALKISDVLVAAQIYQPNLLISEFTGPLALGDLGRSPDFTADWSLARTSVRGTPGAPERVSVVFEDASFNRVNDGQNHPLVSAKRFELHGRMSEPSGDQAVNELVLRLVAASAPWLHAAAAEPLDAEVSAVLRGLKDFAPKPWAVRFRELQANGGQIEIKSMRVQQGNTLAVGNGVIGLSPSGRLDGQLALTVAGIENLLPKLGIERLAPQVAPQVKGLEKLGPALGALEKLSPQIGNIARQQAGTGIAAGIGMLGEPTQLEGRRAIALPLRFANGAAFLGPIQLGQIPPLF